MPEITHPKPEPAWSGCFAAVFLVVVVGFLMWAIDMEDVEHILRMIFGTVKRAWETA